MLFFVGAAAVAWLLVVIPVVIMAARADVVDALRLDTRSASVTRRGARLRHALTVTEIALTVALVASATLSAKSYASLLELPKGFDTTQLATVAVRQRPGSTEKDADLQQRLLETLTRQKGVASVSAGDLPPGAGGGSNSQPSIVGREESLGRVTFRSYDVDPGFFTTMRLPIVRGRALEAGDPPEAVVIDEAFAKRFWPNGDAVGARMDLGKVGWSVRGQFVHELQIVGVAAHLRGATDIPTTTSDGSLIYYRQLFDYAPLTFVVRLDGMSVESLKAVVKSSTPDSRLRIDLVDERYANLFANEMLAAAIMRAFAVFAAIVAIGGVYGIMSFLVAGRRREIGIRMALGADQRDVKRLVIGSAARLALTGTAIGITIAVAGARVFESVLYGVSASDPRPYLVIALGATAAAVFATWQPARRAAGVNPSQLLRD